MYSRARLFLSTVSRWKQLHQPRSARPLQLESRQPWMFRSHAHASTVSASKGEASGEAPRIASGEASGEAPQDEEVQKWGWSMKIAATLLIVSLSVKAAPELAETLVRHSVMLLRMKDPFFQRSGADRLSLIAMDEKRRQAIVKAGAMPLLVALLDPTGDERTNASAVSALANLAQSDAGVDALRTENVEALLSDVATASTNPKICQDVEFLLGKLGQPRDLATEEVA